jgi:hypothetical protein
VRHALVYVLANSRKHARRRAASKLDVYSSAPYFAGFAEYRDELPLEAHARFRTFHENACPVAPAGTWLLGEGWRRHGRISVYESPRDH